MLRKKTFIASKMQSVIGSQDSPGKAQAKQMVQIVKLSRPLTREFSNLQKDEIVLNADVEALLTQIQTLYEGFRPVCGLLLGLFDITQGTPPEQHRVVEYFKGDLNPKEDFYINLKNKMRTGPSLKHFCQNSAYPAIKGTLEIIFGKIHLWRIHTAHHRADTIQDRLGDGIYHVYTRSGLKDVKVKDIITTLMDFIWLFLIIAIQVGALYLIMETRAKLLNSKESSKLKT